ncbi:hypothetical protein EJ08DRAFT_328840 [Tothia fuscella]|uniref:Uncharacterized protein n=1 Tax=Tothia fuscella TaxID=1048955 RepID=A0A9P4TWQ7_9PEZI|nr:hypothetical protein EJ08DRAFT_328840 [Tothia fuscella]
MWSRLPVHTSPLCPLDQVVADLVQARRPYELSGGNIQEFQKRPFPSVQSLLNSENETETEKSPVTTLIVNKIINIMTVPTLPEQLAILWFMGSVIRWLISPTEANYNSMPEWLRPTPAQLECPHPIWMDLFLWPKAREKMCRSPEYHDKIDIMSGVSNESISINWPYQLSDMVMQVNGLGSEIVLTPAFERHMKDLKNWSVGPRMFEVFPGLADTGINIRSTGGVPGWSW